MTEYAGLNLSEAFETPIPSRDQRLAQAYSDPVVQERFKEIMRAGDSERAGLQAQLSVYLAAAHALSPEESQIIHNSLNGPKSG